MRGHHIKRIQELVPLLADAARIYEQEDREIISNKEYDKLYDELLQLEKETGMVLANSVTHKVGYEVLSNLPKVRHNQNILSLDKTKEVSRLVSFIGEEKGMLSWKLDGLTIVITYNNGELVQAITRGNGEIGEDITSNAKTFANLPLKINDKRELTVRGEAIITYSEFERINEHLPDEEKYKNPRNLCSGSVRQLDSQVTSRRNIHFYAFTIVGGGPLTDSKEEQLQWLDDQGFEVVEYKMVTAQTIPESVQWFGEYIRKRDFGSDGLVLTLDSISHSDALGVTAKFPRDSIAFKWKDEIQETKLVAIEWNTSRTGSINPVAIFEPVELEGTTVERASVHNVSILQELALGVGDIIKVYKANMIIPQIAENITKSNTIKIPSHCPVCAGETRIQMIKDAKALYCTNPNCEAKRVKAFVHFVGRDAMNIQGFSEASIEKFIENKFIHEFVDLYHLNQHEEAIKTLEGFGQKSYDKIIKAVEHSRKIGLPNFIYALGIEQIGINNAKLICHYFQYDIEKLMEATEEELMSIEGVGAMIAHSINSYFKLDENKSLINRLMQEIDFIIPEIHNIEESPIANKVFVITGQVNHFKNRKELGQKIEELGGKVVGSVSSKTDYLINNDVHSSSGKNKKAKELDIPIISEEEFLSII
ncbi:MAG TPA: NAD-dependent DNA ligase LigA [Epulopiscium sp.]|nr:NAD-dependent DNA ligase LigA [Candidatus Epulonipiscium sp.]